MTSSLTPIAYCRRCQALGWGVTFLGHCGLFAVTLMVLSQSYAVPLPPPVEVGAIALQVVESPKAAPQPAPVVPPQKEIPQPVQEKPVQKPAIQPIQEKTKQVKRRNQPPPTSTTRQSTQQATPAAQQAQTDTVQHSKATMEAQAKQTLLSYLLAQIEKHKRYPDQARKRGIEGVVRIAVSIDASGNLLSISIQGDGYDPLLAKATQSVVTKIRDGWKSPGSGAPVSVIVPLRYSLTE